MDIVECYIHKKNKELEDDLREDWRMYYMAWLNTRNIEKLITSKEYYEMHTKSIHHISWEEAEKIGDNAHNRLRKNNGD